MPAESSQRCESTETTRCHDYSVRCEGSRDLSLKDKREYSNDYQVQHSPSPAVGLALLIEHFKLVLDSHIIFTMIDITEEFFGYANSKPNRTDSVTNRSAFLEMSCSIAYELQSLTQRLSDL